MGITAVYKETGDRKGLKKYTELAYEKTRKVFPVWPKEMFWGVIDDRQYMRAICDKAALCQQEGDLKEAEWLYHLLLKLNPGDNQGIRYLLAGLFANILPEEIDKLFDQGNESQDWSKPEYLVEEQNRIHHFWQEPNFD